MTRDEKIIRNKVGVPGSNGIRRRGLDRRPRMDKREHGRL